MIAIRITQKQCPRKDACGYKWIPRVAEPKTCPKCKTYLSKDKKTKEGSDVTK